MLNKFGDIMGLENNTKEIGQLLSKVKDPDLNKAFEDLNAVKNIKIDGNKISIELELVQPYLWIEDGIKESCETAVKSSFPDAELDFTINGIGGNANEVLGSVKNIIAVSSGKGGVGKSAIASNIAAALRQKGAKVGVIDGDVYGPSQPTMFGLTGRTLEAEKTEDGETFAHPIEKYGIHIASLGFVLGRDQAAIVRGPMLAGYFSMMFEQVRWPELDFIVFDLPPGTGDIQLTLTQKIPLTGAVVVTTPQEISVADVRRSIAMFKKVNVDILGIIENMSYFIPPDMPDKKYYIFGEGGGKRVADENAVNFLGEVPLNMEMREGNDGGKPIVVADPDGRQSQIISGITSKVVAQTRKHNYKALEEVVEISI